jgi:hypothetical protein
LERLLSFGDEYRPLLNRIAIGFLSAAVLAILAEHFVFPPECVCCGILDRLLHGPPPSGWNSAIVPGFPKVFEDFKEKQFTLLWRGSGDGFRAGDFHGRCDAHPNTLILILDTDGNIFGGFTPVEWKSQTEYPYDKAEPCERIQKVSMNSEVRTKLIAWVDGYLRSNGRHELLE